MALTAQISGQAVLLTIDAANPRYAAGSAASGSQDADLLCINEMFSIRRRAAGDTHPDVADGRPGGQTTPVVRFIPALFSAERAGFHATAGTRASCRTTSKDQAACPLHWES